nr:GNAT family N-acetyltransferase [Neobacillus sp. Marseille-Q6967]
MNIIFKRLTECTPQEIITAWNQGFEGYFVQIELTPEIFFNRLVNEGLSLNHSIVAFDAQQPVGIVVNGFRTIAGKKTAWNGGTGVAVKYRGKGVSRLLMEETLKIYEEEVVDVATLEAIKENEKAIRLYERYGYKINDSLVYLNGTPELKRNHSIQIRTIRPERLPSLSFYKDNIPWQCQWQSVKTGESQVYFNQEQIPLGYSLFKRIWNLEGKLEKVFLFQLELLEVNADLMKAIFAAMTQEESRMVNFTTVNASLSNPAIKYLVENGFKKTTEQVQMVKCFN